MDFGKKNVNEGLQPVPDAGDVPSSRAINTTAPLAGGGPLSADLTLTIAPATSSAAGSMSAADKTKLNLYGSTQAANTVLAGPVSGSAAAPAARALVAADLPQALKAYSVAGNNGAGHVTTTGTKVGDLVISALAWNSGTGAIIGLDTTHFEAVVTVNDQIQQNGTDLSARTFLFHVQPKS